MKLLVIIFSLFGFVGATNNLECAACHQLSSMLSYLDRSKVTKEVVEGIAVPVCEVIKGDHNCKGISCTSLCQGIIKGYAPIILKVWGDELSTNQFCSKLKLCPPEPEPMIPTTPQIISNLSNFKGEKNWSNWNQKDGLGYFVHFTDIHIDKGYTEYMSSNCTLPLCCRNQPGAIKLDPTDKLAAGYWGTVGAPCDIPVRLSEHVHKWFASVEDKPDFVINTGDDPAHNVWEQSRELNSDSLDVVVSHQMMAFKDLPVLSSLGNHEFWPVDSAVGTHEGDLWLYSNSANKWAHWLSDDAIRTVNWGGFYASRARPNIRVIALTTSTIGVDTYYRYDTILKGWPDPLAQMAWLNNTLKQASAMGEKVILIGHHRYSNWNYNVLKVFIDIVSKYDDLILLHLFGHSHMNDFSVTTTPKGKLLYPYFIGGSLTTTGIASNHNQGIGGCGTSGNPGFTVYKYNRSSLEILDVEYWWADLSLTNETTEPVWEKQYSFKDVYQVPKLDVKNIYLASQKINSNSTMKNLYYKIWGKGY